MKIYHDPRDVENANAGSPDKMHEHLPPTTETVKSSTGV